MKLGQPDDYSELLFYHGTSTAVVPAPCSCSRACDLYDAMKSFESQVILNTHMHSMLNCVGENAIFIH